MNCFAFLKVYKRFVRFFVVPPHVHNRVAYHAESSAHQTFVTWSGSSNSRCEWQTKTNALLPF